MKARRLVIAHFATRASLIAAAVFLAICTGFLYPLLHRLPFPYQDAYRLQYTVTFAGLLCICGLAARSLAMLYQLAFHKGAAIWVQGGVLIYLDSLVGIWFEPVPLREIESVRIGPMGRSRRNRLVFQLRDGSQKATRIMFLREAPDVIADRLNQVLQARRG